MFDSLTMFSNRAYPGERGWHVLACLGACVVGAVLLMGCHQEEPPSAPGYYTGAFKAKSVRPGVGGGSATPAPATQPATGAKGQ